MLKPPGLPFSDADIDKEILPLVQALNQKDGVTTLGCCSGHGTESAYIDLAVHGSSGIRWLVSATNAVSKDVGEKAMLDIALNWSDDVPTACDFKQYPEWLMLTLFIECGESAAPTAELLGDLARRYEKISG